MQRQRAKLPTITSGERSHQRLIDRIIIMSISAAGSSGKQQSSSERQHQLCCDCCLNTISDDSIHVQNFPCDVCDCCGNAIIDYIQNNPCKHNVCFLCSAKSNLKRDANPAFYCCQVKDCPQKYRIVSCQYFHRGGIPGEVIENETVVELGTDQIACILSFLPLKEIMLKRRVCKNWREAATVTNVPPGCFCADSVESYNTLRVMTTILPNLQQLSLRDLGLHFGRHKWSDGEEPNEEWAAETANYTTYDMETLSRFSKLRALDIRSYPFLSQLNGRYPFLFNSFPLLQKLSIHTCSRLMWDLEMLSGFPTLKELHCVHNYGMSGNINSLRVLKDTLEKVNIVECPNVEGNFMDLANFPHLKWLDLHGTAVTGDTRDIGEHDFLSLEQLRLPEGVYVPVDFTEYPPQQFRLMAQVLEVTPDGARLRDEYISCFPHLLGRGLWERKSNVPALSRLTVAYLVQVGNVLVPHLMGILGLFQWLVSSKANEVFAFDLLRAIVMYMPRDAFMPRMNDIFRIFLMRLQHSKTPKFVVLITNFFALFVGKFGSHCYMDQLNHIQPGPGLMLLTQIWIPRLQNASPARLEAKTQVVGLTKLLRDTPALLETTKGRQIWSQILACTVKIVISPDSHLTTASGEDDDNEAEIGYDASCSLLHFARRPAVDPFPEVQDAGILLAKAIQRVCASNPGKIAPLIQQGLSVDPRLSAGFERLCQRSGVQLASTE